MHIPSADGPPQSSPSVQRPTTPNQYNLLRNMDSPSADGPPNQAQVYRVLLHQTNRTHWEMRPYPVQMPPNRAQVYRALLHQTSRTYWEMRRPSPANWPQVYRALLHQTSRPYWEIHTYPVQMDPQSSPSVESPPTPKRPSPTNWSQVYRDLLHQTSTDGPP